jgi:hypothetical protein
VVVPNKKAKSERSEGLVFSPLHFKRKREREKERGWPVYMMN